MILTRCLLTLLGIMALQSEGRANLLEENDEQTCMDLCRGCGGTATFEDNICQCHVADHDRQGAECIGRIKRQVQELGLDIVHCNYADADADRPARCILSPFRRFKNRVDGDLIAKYFSGNGLTGFGSLLGSSKQEAEERKSGDADLSATAVNSDSSATSGSNGDQSTSDSVVGAPNPYGGSNLMSGQFVAMNPLVGAAAAWLQPQTLLALRNNMQASNQMDSTQANMVGSPHQNTAGDFRTMQTFDSHANPGMTPYYVVGAPNPIYIQDGPDVLPMQPYLYRYDSMVGAQNPSFMGENNVGSPPYWNCPPSAGGSNTLELPGPSMSMDKGLEETAEAAEDLIGQSNPDPSLELKEDTNSQSDTELKIQNEDDGGVVGSKQTINPEEGKDQTVGSSKQRHSKFRSKKFGTRTETAVEGQHP